MAHGKRSRKGHPKGKAYGFHGLRPAKKTRTGGGSESGESQSQSTASQASQDSESS